MNQHQLGSHEMIMGEIYCRIHIFLKGVGFSSFPRLPGCFHQGIYGGILPSPGRRLSEPESTSYLIKVYPLYAE